MRVATCANDLGEVEVGPFGCIGVDALHGDEFRVEHAGEDLPVEGDGFLVEFLGVANVAEGDFAEGVLWSRG